MKPTVYLETTVISYLAARPSRDLIIAAHQQLTQEWWDERRSNFALYVSQLVIREASAEDEQAAQRRLQALADISLLELNAAALALAKQLTEQGALPKNAPEDALHVAVAAVHGIDYSSVNSIL